MFLIVITCNIILYILCIQITVFIGPICLHTPLHGTVHEVQVTVKVGHCEWYMVTQFIHVTTTFVRAA